MYFCHTKLTHSRSKLPSSRNQSIELNCLLLDLSYLLLVNPLSANPTKWSNTLQQFVGKSRGIVLSVFDHFVRLALKGLNRTASNYKLTFCGEAAYSSKYFRSGRPKMG